jgi:hypothetical protein
MASRLVPLNSVTSQRFRLKTAPGGATTPIQNNQLALAKTAAGAVTVQLPLAVDLVPGNCFGVIDDDGNAAVNPITVDGNGTPIGSAATILISGAGQSVCFVFDGDKFRRLATTRSVEVGGPVVLLDEDVGTAAVQAAAASDATVKANAAQTNAINAAPAAVVSSRVTALDANHLHAWELTEANGNFLDTGSSATKVALAPFGANAANVVYQTKGLLGPCAQFGILPNGLLSASAMGARALVSAFADLPAGSCSLEFWYRSYVTNLGWLAGVDQNGAEIFDVNGNAAAAGQLAMTTRANLFQNTATPTLLRVESSYQWRHFCLAYDGVNANGYLDGELVLTHANSGAVLWANGVTPTLSIALGQNAAGQFIGQLSRVRLSNIARSQAYCRAVYKAAMAL